MMGTEFNNIPEDAKQMAMFCHLAGLLIFVIPLGNVIGTAILWQLKKDMHPFVDDQGKEAINFHLVMLIAGLICTALTVVLIGIPLLIVLVFFAIVYTIIVALQAIQGDKYRYILVTRLIH